MRARARALMDTSDVALRRMQGQARLSVPLNDAQRLGTLYGGAMASMELRDFHGGHADDRAAEEVLASMPRRSAAQDERRRAAAPAGRPRPWSSRPASTRSSPRWRAISLLLRVEEASASARRRRSSRPSRRSAKIVRVRR